MRTNVVQAVQEFGEQVRTVAGTLNATADDYVRTERAATQRVSEQGPS